MTRGFLVAAVVACLAGCDAKRTAPGERSGPPPAAPSAQTRSRGPVNPELAALLPAEAGGYKPSGEDGHYDRRSIFDLLDGGAEVLLALNLKAAVSRRYTRPGAPELSVDVFDMGSHSDAFGAYHHDTREGSSAGLGRESELGSSSVFFWKDRYYVSVVALANTPEAREAVKAMGQAVAERIPTLGQPPRIVAFLPPKGLVASQVHYFHTWQLLRSHYAFPTEDLLGLGSDTEGVLARYGRAALFVVRYPSAAHAEQGRWRFALGWLAGADAGIGYKEGGWAGIMADGDVVIGVLDAGSAEQVSELMKAAKQTRSTTR